jgi:hypothetical protein
MTTLQSQNPRTFVTFQSNKIDNPKKSKIQIVNVSYISGDGFPVLTSSPAMMTEKDPFQPVSRYNQQPSK